MNIRRLTVTLPAHMKDSAQHDVRQIAQALAQALYANGGQASNVTLEGHGQNAALLAQRVAAAISKGGQHGR